MKTMKTFCTAIVLSLTISISAFAGDIATPGAVGTGDPSTGTVSTGPSAPCYDTIGICELDASVLGDVFLTLLSMF
ncbi:MAG: hypothetical protein ABR557_06915 [Pyrinomonadaceae bacterium]